MTKILSLYKAKIIIRTLCWQTTLRQKSRAALHLTVKNLDTYDKCIILQILYVSYTYKLVLVVFILNYRKYMFVI